MTGDYLYGNVGGVYTQLKTHVTWPVILWTSAVIIPTWIAYKLLVEPLLSPLQKIPGDKFVPLFGNMPEILRSETMAYTIKVLKEYGPIVRHHFFLGIPRVTIGGPAAMKHMLVTNCKNYVKPTDGVGFLRRVLGEGLITTEGKTHARHKKLMNPAFNQTAILKMVPIFNTYARKFVDFYKEKLDTVHKSNGDGKKPSLQLPFLKDVSRLTLDVIGKSAFGYEFNSIRNPDNSVSQAFNRIVNGDVLLNIKELVLFYSGIKSERMKQIDHDAKVVHSEIQRIVDLKNKAKEEAGDNFVSRDLLDIMMLAQDEVTGIGLTDKELRDQVITIMAAGHETTSVALSWCLHALSQNQSIQKRAREEISSVLSTHKEEDDITLENLDNMEYVTAVCKETLRYYPPVPLTVRQALEDDVIEGYFIPKGTKVILGIGAMMRISENVKDGGVFNPDRWLNGGSLDLYTFLPFLIGPRMCLGYKFALTEMKLILVYLLKHFHFDPVPGVNIKRRTGGVTMRPYPSLELNVSLSQ